MASHHPTSKRRSTPDDYESSFGRLVHVKSVLALDDELSFGIEFMDAAGNRTRIRITTDDAARLSFRITDLFYMLLTDFQRLRWFGRPKVRPVTPGKLRRPR